MKKAIKWISISVGILVGLLIVGAIAFPLIFPLEKIKDIATEKISQTINRKVTIEKVSFNIFKGISLEKLTISNRVGFAKKPFVSADAIVLRYAFWPLFQGQLLVKELRLEKPEILIEKSAAGVYNFSDMTKKRKPTPKKKKAREIPFSMIVDTFSIRNGHITYSDYGTKTSSEIKKANLTVSGVTLAMAKPIGLDFSAIATYKEKDIPLSISGKIAADLAKNALNIPSLTLKVAGEKANITANISRLKAGPWIDFTLSSSKFSLDPLLAVFTAGATEKKKKAPRGVLTKTVYNATKGISSRLRLNGNVDIEDLTFQAVKVNKVKLGIGLRNKILSVDIKNIKAFDGALTGKASVNLSTYGLSYNVSSLKLSGLNASPFSNAMVETFLTKLPDYQDLTNKVYGTLDASLKLSGQGVETQDIMANASASGNFSLKDGELKRLKIIDAIADKIKTAKLKQDLKISELSGSFTFRNQIANIKNLSLKNGDLQVGFDGGLDLAKLRYVPGNRLRLRGSPGLTQGLSREYNLLRDKDGWLEMTFELKGSLKKPLPFPILEKAFEKGVEKVKEKAAEAVDKAKEEARKKAEEEKKRLEEEAKRKLKEEAEKKARELLKF
jgi:hypothetical protein